MAAPSSLRRKQPPSSVGGHRPAPLRARTKMPFPSLRIAMSDSQRSSVASSRQPLPPPPMPQPADTQPPLGPEWYPIPPPAAPPPPASPPRNLDGALWTPVGLASAPPSPPGLVPSPARSYRGDRRAIQGSPKRMSPSPGRAGSFTSPGRAGSFTSLRRPHSPIRGSPKRPRPSASEKRPAGGSVHRADAPHFLHSQWRSDAEPGATVVTGVLDVVTMSLRSVDPSYHGSLRDAARSDVSAAFEHPFERTEVELGADLRVRYVLAVVGTAEAGVVAARVAEKTRRRAVRLPALERCYRAVSGCDVAAVVNAAASEGPTVGHRSARAPREAAAPSPPPLPQLPPPVPPAESVLDLSAVSSRPPAVVSPQRGRALWAAGGTLSSIGGAAAALQRPRRAQPASADSSLSGQMRDETARLDAAVAAADLPRQAAALGALGSLLCRHGDHRAAVGYLQRHLVCLETLAEGSRPDAPVRRDLAKACSQLGNAHWLLGSLDDAMALHRRRLALASEAGDRAGMGAAFGNLGNVCHAKGDYRSACEHHEEHRRCVPDGDVQTLAAVYHNLGLAHFGAGDTGAALDCFRHSLEIALSLGDAAQKSRAHSNLAMAYRARNQLQEAVTELHLCLKVEEGSGDGAAAAATCFNIGNVYRMCGDAGNGGKYFNRGIHLARGTRDGSVSDLLCSLLVAAGGVYCDKEDGETAAPLLDEAVEIARSSGSSSLLAAACSQQGVCKTLLGELASAKTCHSEHLALARSTGDAVGEAAAHSNLGSVCLKAGDIQGAIDHYEADLCIAVALSDLRSQSQACDNLGAACCRLGEFKLALEYHTKALDMCSRGGDDAAAAHVHGHIGEVYESLADAATAAEHHRQHWEIAKRRSDSKSQLRALNALARCSTASGSIAAAQEYRREAAAVARAAGDRESESVALAHLSVLDSDSAPLHPDCVVGVDDAGGGVNRIQCEVASVMRGGAANEAQDLAAALRLSSLAEHTLRIVQVRA